MKTIQNKILNCETIPWSELKTYEFNTLKEEQGRDVTKLKHSIVNDGFDDAFDIWADHKYVIDGTGRQMALLELESEGYEIPDLPVVKIEANTKKQAIKIVLKRNGNHGKVTNQSLSDFTSVDFEIEELKLMLVEDLNMPELEVLIGSLEVEELPPQEGQDDIPEPRKETKIVEGDIFEFKINDNFYRFGCGDSTSIDFVEKVLEGQKVDLAHNDPPYGMKKEKDGVLGDNMNYDDLLEFNRQWIATQWTVLKDNGSWYCWGIDEPLMDIYSEILKPLISEQKATFRNLITWDKGNGQGQMSDGFRMYPIADEKCLFAMCGVQGFNNNADNYFEGWDSIVNYLDAEKNKAKLTIKDCKRLAGHSEKSGCHWFDKSQWMMPTKETYDSWRNHCQQNNIDGFKKEYEELKKEYEELKKEYYSTRAYFNNTHDNQNNVWHFERTGNQERENTGNHATPKPIALCERVIKSSCPENGLVIDAFLGSGSTIIACIKNKRNCTGCELDPFYVDTIVNRIKKYCEQNDIDYSFKHKNGNLTLEELTA